MNGRTVVYRLYDKANELLYVGISSRFGVRWLEHAGSKPWWPEVDHVTLQLYDTREEALSIETDAIERERPLYNVVHAPGGPRRHVAVATPGPTTEGAARIRAARDEYDYWYHELIAAIREGISSGAVSVSEASRQAKWSRTYIDQIRDGAAGETPPKRRAPRSPESCQPQQGEQTGRDRERAGQCRHRSLP